MKAEVKHAKIRSVKVAAASFVFALICFCAGPCPAPGASSPRDITRQVYDQTDFEEQIQQFCDSYCQGNERKGTLLSVTIQEIGRNLHRAVVYVTLQNRHETGPPLNITPFDWTVAVRAFGSLDAEHCVLTIDDLQVENDLSNILSNLANQYRGTRHQIPHCKRFLQEQAKRK